MQNQENKREKRKLTLPQLKLIVGSAALVVLTVLLTLGLNSVFRHDEKPTHLGFEDIGELATQAAYLTIVEDIDASRELFDVMAHSQHIPHYIHLPFQSGNDRVLKEMNRRYTRQQYLDLVNYAKRVMPGLVLTSDVIIGFPGETEAEAMDTVSLVEEVGFDALFTFIYSPRPGTKAAAMPDPATRAEKQKWFDRLLEVQNHMSAKLHAAYVGKTVRVLVDGESDDPEYPLTSRTEGNRLVRLKGDKALIGQFADVAVTGSNTWALYGEAV